MLLQRDEPPDTAGPCLAHLSPVSYALSPAERDKVSYVLLVTQTGLRLHPVRDRVGVRLQFAVTTPYEAVCEPTGASPTAKGARKILLTLQQKPLTARGRCGMMDKGSATVHKRRRHEFGVPR